MATSPVPDDRLRQQLEELLSLSATDPQAALLKDLLGSVFRLQEQRLDMLDLKILHRSLREMRYAFRLFTQYRHRRKVAVFGSARMPSENPLYDLARRFARLLAKRGFMVITGAAKGAVRAGQHAGGQADRPGGSRLVPSGPLGRGRRGRDRGLLPQLSFQPVRERAAGAAAAASVDARTGGRPQRAVCPPVPGGQD